MQYEDLPFSSPFSLSSEKGLLVPLDRVPLT
eukprot:COSAG02_NODE_36131_length_458_cov_1.275766_1_plen_30_part_10